MKPLHRERCSISRAFFYIFLYPKSLCPPFCPEPSVSQTSPWTSSEPVGSSYKRQCSISRAIDYFIHSYLLESPLKELSHNTRVKEYGHRPRSPTRTEGLHTMGCGLVPQGDRSATLLLTTPVPCSLQHDTFHLGLGRPEPR
jgi:hypothetical protein